MQTPLGTGGDNAEMWRYTPDGKNDYIFEDPSGTVHDAESFGGVVWFTVTYYMNSGHDLPGL